MPSLTIVTTAGRPDEKSEELAKKAADILNIAVVPRKKRSVSRMQKEYNANVIVAGKNRYEYYPYSVTEPFFFHPNSAAYRLKRLEKGGTDPLIEVCRLQQGDRFLDCTLGLGSDSIVAKYVVGHRGRVVGLEANPNVAFIVKNGMQSYDVTEMPLAACMRDIEVIQANAIAYLRTLADNSFDVVYMDPMFEKIIEESDNFTPLRAAGEKTVISDEWVAEATRVAKRGVVLKAYFDSPLFERYGFTRDIRLSSKFHFGFLSN